MTPATAPEPEHTPEVQDFERIYREHAPLVFRTAWGVLGSREDAEDVLQAVFLKLLRRDVAPDLLAHPRAYLHKAAVTVSLDLLKSRRRRPVPLPVQPGARFDDEMHERLLEAIGQLPPEAAEVLLLRYMQERSLAEIAETLGVSRAAVAVRLFRARTRLKARLGARP